MIWSMILILVGNSCGVVGVGHVVLSYFGLFGLARIISVKTSPV